MKTKNFILSALFAAGISMLIFYGCKNQNIQPKVTSDASGSNVVSAPYVALSFNPNPGVVGLPFIATSTLNPVPVCGSLYVDQAQYIADALDGSYHAGDPAPTSATLTSPALAQFVHVGGAQGNVPTGVPVSSDPNFIPTTPELIGYRAHFDPGNPGSGCGVNVSGYNGNPQVAIDAVIGSATCTPGLSPKFGSAVIVPGTADKKGNTFTFVVSFNLSSCGQGIIGKLQGGLIAGASIVSSDTPGSLTTPGYSISSTAKSTVITWANATDGIYVVQYTAHVLSIPQPSLGSPITGAWSFKWNTAVYGGTGYYGYTSPIMYNY